MSRNSTVATMQPDPNVKVPAAIRAAAARSDALHAAAYETQPEAGQEQNNGGTEGQSKEPKPAPAPAQAPQSEAPPAQAPQPENFEHKYHSLKGRFDQQERVVAGLRQRIAELETAASQPPAQAPKAPANPELRFKPLTPEERESYGDDFIDVATRAAAEKLFPEITQLRADLDAANATLRQTQQSQGASAAQVMNAKLNEKLPNWREINRSQKFLDWLALPDALSGVTRIGMLRDAHSRSDADRVLAFFNGFLADEAATDPANNQPAPPAQPGKPKLEDFAAPGRAKAPAAAPAPGQKETISRSQIANFYALVQKGHYRGNDAEKERLERMIFDAEREGLIVD